jgi:hypothetical protein
VTVNGVGEFIILLSSVQAVTGNGNPSW